MTIYKFTSPEGVNYEVEGEGSEADALAHLQAQIQGQFEQQLPIEQQVPVPYGPDSGMLSDGVIAPPTPEEPYSFSPMNMLANVPQSGANIGWNMYNAAANPIDTLNTLGKTAYGYAEKLIPGEQEHEQYADTMNKSMGQRYGSMMNLLKTIEKDPLGVMADASGVVSGAGLAARAIPGAGRVGRMVQTAGEAIDPLSLAVRGTAAVAPSPAGLYKSAAKYGTTVDRAKRDSMAETGLREKITTTESGVDKSQVIIDVLNDEVSRVIQQADAAGTMIPKDWLYRYLDDSRDKFGGIKLEGKKDVERIDKMVDDFESQLDIIGRDTISPSELQKLKQGVYKRVSYDKKSGRTRESVEHAQKGIARSAKEILEVIDPSIKATNERLGKLYEWQDKSIQSANRIANRDVMGIGIPIKAGAGAAIAEGLLPGTSMVGGGIGALIGLLDTPAIKSNLAIKLQKLKDMAEQTGDWTNYMPAARQLLMQAGKAEGLLGEIGEE